MKKLMKNDDKQQKAAEKISFFLETFFATLTTFGVAMYITKDYKIVVQDKETNLIKTFTPAEFQALYDKWEESFEKTKEA